MGTTVTMLNEWFDRGVKDKQRWMVIICDTFDYDDFPCYFKDDEIEKCLMKISNAQSGKNMQQLMEVYDLDMPKDKQFGGPRGSRVMNLPVMGDDDE
jgi:hypothetical protein